MCKEDAVDTLSEISYNIVTEASHKYNALSLVFLLSSSQKEKTVCDTFLSLENSTLPRHFPLNLCNIF